ncbi:hypothetical protein J6590_058748 [Homalodisca vitripennis]|nr:hypothetical protein J6590_058748 [Homalodisca vitripennis]
MPIGFNSDHKPNVVQSAHLRQSLARQTETRQARGVIRPRQAFLRMCGYRNAKIWTGEAIYLGSRKSGERTEAIAAVHTIDTGHPLLYVYLCPILVSLHGACENIQIRDMGLCLAERKSGERTEAIAAVHTIDTGHPLLYVYLSPILVSLHGACENIQIRDKGVCLAEGKSVERTEAIAAVHTIDTGHPLLYVYLSPLLGSLHGACENIQIRDKGLCLAERKSGERTEAIAAVHTIDTGHPLLYVYLSPILVSLRGACENIQIRDKGVCLAERKSGERTEAIAAVHMRGVYCPDRNCTHPSFPTSVTTVYATRCGTTSPLLVNFRALQESDRKCIYSSRPTSVSLIRVIPVSVDDSLCYTLRHHFTSPR